MHLTKCVTKSNYFMTDEELNQWQRNTIIWCEFDNFLNNIIAGRLQDNVSDLLEESAINMAIESHGIQPRQQTTIHPILRNNNNIISIIEGGDMNFFDQQAINAAINFEGLGIPPWR